MSAKTNLDEKGWHYYEEDTYVWATQNQIWHNSDIKAKNLGTLECVGSATEETEYWAASGMDMGNATPTCQRYLREALCDSARKLDANVCKLGKYSEYGCMATVAKQSANFFKSEKLA